MASIRKGTNMPKEKKDSAQEVNVRELMTEYEASAKTVTGICTGLLENIEAGIAAFDIEANTSTLGEALRQMRDMYDAVRDAAAPDQEEKPRSIYEYAKQAEKRKKESAELHRREILEEFLTVQSAHQSYAEALAPYQKKAASVLASKRPVTVAEARGPLLFLECLQLDHINSPEGEALLEELETFYPVVKIHRGLSFGEYSQPDDSSGTQEDEGEADDEDDQPSPQSVEEPEEEPSSASRPDAEPAPEEAGNISAQPVEEGEDLKEAPASSEPESESAPVDSQVAAEAIEKPAHVEGINAARASQTPLKPSREVDPSEPAAEDEAQSALEKLPQNDAPTTRETEPAGEPQAVRAEEAPVEVVLPEEVEALPAPTPEEIRAQDLYPPLQPLLYPVRTVDQFRQDIVCNPLSKYIVPWLTRYGALKQEHLVAMLERIAPDVARAYDFSAVSASVARLADRDLVALYDLDRTGNAKDAAILMTQYCYDRATDEALCGLGLWHSELATAPVIAPQGLAREPLCSQRLAINSLFPEYDAWACRLAATRPLVQRYLLTSINWQHDHYSVVVTWKGEIVTCVVCDRNSTPPVEGSILLLDQDPLSFRPEFEPENGSWYTVSGNILRWNGEVWVREKEDGDTSKTTRIASLQSALEKRGLIKPQQRVDQARREQEKHKKAKPTSDAIPSIMLAKPIVEVHRKESGFKTDVKNIPMARVLLPLISTFGVVTEKALGVYGRLLAPDDFENFQDRALHSSLSRLMRKGILAAYQTDPSLALGDAYCRTRYCYDFMCKPSVREDSGLWQAPYGNVPVVAENDLPPVVFDLVEIDGLPLAYYLYWLHKNFDAETYAELCSSVGWLGSKMLLKVPWNEQDVPCMLSTPEDMTENGRNYLCVDVGKSARSNTRLLKAAAPEFAGIRITTETGESYDAYEDEDEYPTFEPVSLEKSLIFCLHGDELYRWTDSDWILENEEMNDELAWDVMNDYRPMSDNPVEAFGDTGQLTKKYLDREASGQFNIRKALMEFNSLVQATDSLRALAEHGGHIDEADYHHVMRSALDRYDMMEIDEVDNPPATETATIPATLIFDEQRPIQVPVFKEAVASIQGASVTLPLLHDMGALTSAQILRAARITGGLPSANKMTVDELNLTLNHMEENELIASYELDEDTIAYCLTEYAAKCMERKLVRESDVWSIPYNKLLIQPAFDMSVAVLDDTLERNDALLAYYAWATTSILELGKKDFLRILGNRPEGKDYCVPIQWNGFPLSVTISPGLAPDGGPLTEDTLIVADEEADRLMLYDTQNIPKNAAQSNLLFTLRKRRLSRWNGVRWTTEKQDRRAEQEQAEREETARRALETASHKERESQKAPEQAAIPKHETKGTRVKSRPDPRPEPVPKAPVDPLARLTGRELALQLLKEEIEPSQDDRRWSLLVEKLLGENRVIAEGDRVENTIAQALVLSKALALHDERNEPTYQKLVLGLDSRIEDHRYLGTQISHLFADAQPASLKLMTLLRAMFAPDMDYDFALREFAHTTLDNYEEQFPGLDDVKALYGVLLDTLDNTSAAFSPAVLRSFANRKEQGALLAQIVENAGRLIERPTVKSGLKVTPVMLTQCFGQGSDLATAMEIVHADDRKRRKEVEKVYSQFQGADGLWSEDLIAAYYEDQWRKATEKVSGPPEVFSFLRRKLAELITARVDVMGCWLDLTDEKGKEKTRWAATRRNSVLKEIKRVLPKLSKLPAYDAAVLGDGIRALESRLEGQLTQSQDDFADLLRTGLFSLDERNLPRMDEELPEFPHFEPWRNALRHIGAKPAGLLKVLDRISNPADPNLYDNLGQAVDICTYLKDRVPNAPSASQYRADMDTASRSALGDVEALASAIGAAHASGQITSQDERTLRGMLYKDDGELSDMVESFNEIHNYGCMHTFLDSVRKTLKAIGTKRADALQAVIERRRQEATTGRAVELLDTAMRHVNERNFGAAEEYLNRYDTNAPMPEEFHPEMSFADFTKMYRHIYQFCAKQKNAHIGTFGVRFVEQALGKPSPETEAIVRDAKDLLRAVPTRREDATPDRIKSLLEKVGLHPANVTRISQSSLGGGECRYSAEIRPAPHGAESYPHPLSPLGTRLPETMDVVCLFGRRQPNDLSNRIQKLNLADPTIVFYNSALDPHARRQLAERFHKEGGNRKSVLIVDWVLLLFLAMARPEDRLRALVACTTPYATAMQPFAAPGDRVLDEMFFGRREEIAQLLDPAGPVFVQGGPQVGKSALFERVRDLANKPEDKEYAVLLRDSDMRKHDDCEFAYMLAQALSADGLAVKGSDSVKHLCATLRASYKKGAWKKILVLVDGAERLVEDFGGSRTPFEQLRALSDLNRTTDGGFKCIFGGYGKIGSLAELARIDSDAIGGTMRLGPLNERDAMDLLWTPLSFLGFQLEPDTVERLLVNTNYYPGNIHAVGRRIVKNVTDEYGSYYNANSNPPYTLSEAQIADLLGDPALADILQNQIRSCLAIDPLGVALARSVAYLAWEEPEKQDSGYTIAEILDYAQLLGHDMPKADDPALKAALADLEDQRILLELPGHLFRLRHQSLKDVIGTREQIEADASREHGEQGSA